MIMYEILYEHVNPFPNVNYAEVKMSQDANYRPSLSGAISADKAWFVVLMQQCWRSEGKLRPSFDFIVAELEMQIAAAK